MKKYPELMKKIGTPIRPIRNNSLLLNIAQDELEVTKELCAQSTLIIAKPLK